MEDEPVAQIPFASDYERWKRQLSTAEYETVMAEFNRLIDKRLEERSADDQIHTAGWIPGNDWDNTVYAPIYYKSARGDHVESAKCFGLFCYVAFMQRREKWIVGKFELNGCAIGSNTYFMRR
jgi:hypothetical protein